MALVKQWIGGFLKRHKARFSPHDWPTGDDAEESREYLLCWITAFATRLVTEAEADEASRLLGPTPPNFRREHLPMVLDRVEEIRRSRGGPAAGTSTREVARDVSRGCPHCGSDGLAMAWSESPDPLRRIPETVAAYCVCPHGRWIKRAHAEKSPEMLRKIPDFAQVLDGLAPGWLDHPPGRPEFSVGYYGEPADVADPEPAPEFDRRRIAGMFQSS
jgi:hypothetical protein